MTTATSRPTLAQFEAALDNVHDVTQQTSS